MGTETYITVPSFFKCPISLDVMRSPVSLCTGVTYDRASIQRWLDGGNNTCPATMQVLRTKEFIPNLTLQRLIKAWSDSVGRYAAASPPPDPTLKEVNESLRRLSLEKDDEIRLEILVRFVKDSDANRAFLSARKDLVPMLVDIIAGGTRTTTRIKLVLLAIKILDSITNGGSEGDRKRLSNLMLTNGGGDCLTAILLAIQRGKLESKIESVRVLEVVSSFDAKSKLLIAERDEILTEVIKSISTESDPTLIEASLSFLITIAKSKRVRSKLIAAKTITKIKDILLTEETPSVAVTEKSLKLLETLTSKREGRSEICRGDGGRCVEGVVRKLLKVSTTATKHAVTILWCLCYVFGEDKRVKETVERSNGVTKLLVVIQSNCSPMVRQMAKDVIKVLKVKVNSAGVLDPKYPSIANTSVEDFDRTFSVNTKGAFLCSKEAANRLKQGGGGRIILLTSSMTRGLKPGFGAYAASKAAVETMVKILAKELKGTGITANCVAPGPIATEMFFEGKSSEVVEKIAAENPFGRVGEVRDVVPLVGFLAGDGGEWINGQIIPVNGGYV